jgi:hypothetical protein
VQHFSTTRVALINSLIMDNDVVPVTLPQDNLIRYRIPHTQHEAAGGAVDVRR